MSYTNASIVTYKLSESGQSSKDDELINVLFSIIFLKNSGTS